MASSTLTIRRVAALILPPILIHLVYAVVLFRVADGFNLSLWSSSVVVTWVAVVATFFLHMVHGYRVLAIVVVPITIVVLVLANWMSPSEGSTISTASVSIHVLISLLAYAILALAAIQAGAILALHRSLKQHDSTTFIKMMPPLQLVESTSMGLLWVGILLLTLSITTGFTMLWDELQRGNYWYHMGLAVGCWCAYLALLGGQLWFGWRGQTSARLSLAAFSLLVVGYLGLRITFGFGM